MQFILFHCFNNQKVHSGYKNINVCMYDRDHERKINTHRAQAISLASYGYLSMLRRSCLP